MTKDQEIDILKEKLVAFEKALKNLHQTLSSQEDSKSKRQAESIERFLKNQGLI